MEYCCEDFEDALYDWIFVAVYPSGKEFLIHDVRIHYCPFCGKGLI